MKLTYKTVNDLRHVKNTKVREGKVRGPVVSVQSSMEHSLERGGFSDKENFLNWKDFVVRTKCKGSCPWKSQRDNYRN